MEKTSCNIPTPEELRNYIKESVISVTGTYEQSASVLMVDDSTIGTLGNFSASIGKAKSKKTFNVSAIAAAALKHTVLHQNKNDEHARGHVGTELNNKAETVMQIEPDKDDKSISVVEVIHSRDREFEPFAFRVNDDSLPELVESYQPQKRQPGRPPKEPFNPYKEIPEDTHRSALNAAFEDGNIGGYNGYLERLKEGYGRLGIKLGYNKTVELAKFLCNKRMVVKEGKEYKFNRDFHY